MYKDKNLNDDCFFHLCRRKLFRTNPFPIFQYSFIHKFYSPDYSHKLSQEKKYKAQSMKESGLFSERSDKTGYIDRFRDRIMFTIYVKYN